MPLLEYRTGSEVREVIAFFGSGVSAAAEVEVSSASIN